MPLPGSAKAEYLSWGLSNYRHPDWLGSARLESSTTHGIVQDTAYDAFGVPYSELSGGNGELSYTGQNKDTAWLQYDFRDRQYDPKQGRWISPDPTGLKAVDFTSPQTWNRYAYVQNNPLALVDPFGDDGCYDDVYGVQHCSIPDYYNASFNAPGPIGPQGLSPAPGLNPTNGGIQNTDNMTGQMATLGNPGEFDMLPAALLYAITPGSAGEASQLSTIWQNQWDAQAQSTATGVGVPSAPPGPNVGPPPSWFQGSITDFLGFELAGYFPSAISGLPPGPSWTTQVGSNCGKAGKAIQTFISQHPGSPIPENLLSAAATCSNHP